jgi:hypothetical protein
MSSFEITLVAVATMPLAAAAFFVDRQLRSRISKLSNSQRIALAALIISSVTAFSGVYFGWQSDRRDAAESELRVRELQLKVNQLERTLQNSS